MWNLKKGSATLMPKKIDLLGEPTAKEVIILYHGPCKSFPTVHP